MLQNADAAPGADGRSSCWPSPPIYRVVPHRTIQWRHAIAGALLATLLFEAGEVGHRPVPGQLQFVLEDLRHARLRADLPAVDLPELGRDPARRVAGLVDVGVPLPAGERCACRSGYEIYGLLRLLGRFNEARSKAAACTATTSSSWSRCSPTRWCSRCSRSCDEINVVRRAENGEWLLTRDLDELTLAELYEACQLRIPIAEAHAAVPRRRARAVAPSPRSTNCASRCASCSSAASSTIHAEEV